MPDGRATEQPFFNPLHPAFHANPYPVYARMRAEDPVHWCALGAGFWAVTRYDDIARLLADGRLGMGSWSETKSRQLGFGAAACRPRRRRSPVLRRGPALLPGRFARPAQMRGRVTLPGALLREAEVTERPLRWRPSSLNHVLERLPLRL
ncbi:MAG: hypothetical protein ABW298_04955 [Candidatus Binatia bacterium]